MPKTKTVKKAPSSPLQLVLQWLTYAFWGWLLLAFAWNIALIVHTFLSGDTSNSEMTSYSMAALIVLLPIAAVTDFLYHRHETQQKSGGASAIMAIHAVLFALCGIGSLIIAVFVGVSLFTAASQDLSEQYTAIWTALIMAMLYGLVFLRVVNPMKWRRVGKIYTLTMIAIGIVLLVATVMGPLANSLHSRDDRQVTESLYDIDQAVKRYARNHQALPKDLSQVDLSGNEEDVVRRDLVNIRPAEKIASEILSKRGYQSKLTYQLCANYTTKLNANDGHTTYDDVSLSEEDSLYVSSHPAGEVCYDQAVYFPRNSTEVKSQF